MHKTVLAFFGNYVRIYAVLHHGDDKNVRTHGKSG